MPGFATSHPRATPAPGRAGSDIGRQQRIAGQFEGFTTVWLQGESAPVAADCGLAEAADFGHGARVPVGGARRLGFQNFDNYVFHLFIRKPAGRGSSSSPSTRPAGTANATCLPWATSLPPAQASTMWACKGPALAPVCAGASNSTASAAVG